MAIQVPPSVDKLEGLVTGFARADPADPSRVAALSHGWRRLGACFVLLGLCACGSKPAVPEKIEMEFAISSSATVNPDVNGRSSPVVLVIMQLRAQDKFAAADFFSLYEPGAAILGDHSALVVHATTLAMASTIVGSNWWPEARSRIARARS